MKSFKQHLAEARHEAAVFYFNGDLVKAKNFANGDFWNWIEMENDHVTVEYTEEYDDEGMGGVVYKKESYIWVYGYGPHSTKDWKNFAKAAVKAFRGKIELERFVP